jgi:hypothetical protein
MTVGSNASANIKKAKRILSRAEAMVERMHASENSEEITNSWESFVGLWVKARRFALQGAQLSNLAEIADTIDKSGNDPVLQYVFQSRNSDEHKSESIAETELGKLLCAPPWFPAIAFNDVTNNLALEVPTPRGPCRWWFRTGGIVEHEGVDLPYSVVDVHLLRLLSIENRGVKYDVPVSQHGKPMYAQEVARYCVDWLGKQCAALET